MIRSIRGKMIVFIGLPIALILIVALWWIVAYAEKQAHQIEQAAMAERASDAAARFDAYIDRASRVADTTARFFEYLPEIDDEMIYRVLEGTVQLNGRIYGAAMAFEPGTYKAGDTLHAPYVFDDRLSGKPKRMNITRDVYDWYADEQWEWWHLPKKEQKGVWTAPYFDEGAGNILMTTYSAPFSRDGDFAGVTTIDIDLEMLQQNVEQELPGLGNFYILGPSGDIISSPDTGDILNRTIFDRIEGTEGGSVAEDVRTMLDGGSGEMVLDRLFHNHKVVVAYAPIRSAGWTYLSYQPEKELMREFHRSRTIVVSALLVALLLIIATLLHISRKLAHPIGRLEQQVRKLADGSSTEAVAGIRTGDEIEVLADAFNVMQDKVVDREQQLEGARETTLDELLESSPDAMLVVDSEGVVRRLNERVVDMFCHAREELMDAPVETLLPERFVDTHGEHLKAYFRDPKARRMGVGIELFGRRHDGSTFPVEIALSPFHEPEGLRAVAAIRDVTEQKQAEAELELARQQAEAANHAKSEFLSSMSHELRTPLNGILGYAQILQRDRTVQPRQKENVDSIISCGDHLLSLINDVLDLSKIEAGHVDLTLAPCDLDRLLKSLQDIVSERARNKGLELKVEVAPEIPQGIVTDAPKLRQVLVNLLGNAVKFTSEGGVTLRVMETADRHLRFEVEDSGVGMDAHEIEEIFDPFKQVEAGKAAGGTGLGLAICRKLLHHMEGTIDVMSKKGEGSTFRVTIPLEEVDVGDLNAADFHDAGQSEGVLAPGQDCRILVADDRDTNRHILEQMLGEVGFKVSLADDGDTALDLLRSEKIDLVLLDVRMPRLNGIETVRQIRQDPKLRELPVIAVTASVFPEFREKAIESGFNDFLGKPFRASELMQLLQSLLDVVWVQEGVGDGDPDGGESPGLYLEPENLERFRKALKIKNLTAMNALADELASHPASAAAAAEIARLTRSFDFQGLEDLASELDES